MSKVIADVRARRRCLLTAARPVALPLLGALALALSGCSLTGLTTSPPTPVSSRPSYGVAPSASLGPPAPGNTRFDRPGYAITFDYPSRLGLRTDVTSSRSEGANAGDEVGLGFADHNGIFVSRRTLRASVTDASLDQVVPEADRVMSQIAGHAVHGTEVEIAGLPGLEYHISINSVPPVRSRYVIPVDGPTEYSLDCQSTTDHRSEIDAACQTALATLHRR